MDSVKILCISDINEIQSVLQSCSSCFYNQEFNNLSCIKGLSQKFATYGRVLVAYHKDEMLGFCAYYANDTDNYIAYLSMIILFPDARGKGVSTLLLNAMLDDCKKLGMRSVELEVADSNERAIRFYKNKGFTLKYRKTDTTCIYYTKLKSEG